MRLNRCIKTHIVRLNGCAKPHSQIKWSLMKDFKLILPILAEQNPWWQGSVIPDYLAPPTQRPLAKYLWKQLLSSRLKRHLIILGPRRVGKTTVMYQTVQHLLKNQIPPDKIQWVRLDHPLLMSLDLGSLVKEAIKKAKATKKQPLYLFLDELAYAEKWDSWLKTFYDEHWPVIIVASSSATAALKKGRESGVGRWEEFQLTPYLLTELLELTGKTIEIPKYEKKICLFNTIKHLSQSLSHTQFNFEKERKFLISLGGFPEILMGIKKEEENYFHKTREILRSDAIEKAIYKDIPQSYRIDSPMILERLLYVLAGQITGLLSLKGISKDISHSSATLDRYLNYLIQTYLVFTLSNYSKNERNIQRRQRKTYFVDIAIRNAALLKEREQIFNDPSELGKLHENLVASHLHHLGQQSGIRLFHWRRGNHEVDLVYDDPVLPMAFEIGTSKSHSRSGLKNFLKENPKFQKACYYVAPGLPFLSAEDSSSGVGDLPLDLLLLAIGWQQDKVLSLSLGN